MSNTPAEADAKTERAVLAFVLQLHPTRLSRGELARALAEDPDDFAQRDAVCRAVDELAAAGLLHRAATSSPRPVPPCASTSSPSEPAPNWGANSRSRSLSFV